jgi:hypothetical protein
MSPGSRMWIAGRCSPAYPALVIQSREVFACVCRSNVISAGIHDSVQHLQNRGIAELRLSDRRYPFMTCHSRGPIRARAGWALPTRKSHCAPPVDSTNAVNGGSPRASLVGEAIELSSTASRAPQSFAPSAAMRWH